MWKKNTNTIFLQIVSAETTLFWIKPYVVWPLFTVHTFDHCSCVLKHHFGYQRMIIQVSPSLHQMVSMTQHASISNMDHHGSKVQYLDLMDVLGQLCYPVNFDELECLAHAFLHYFSWICFIQYKRLFRTKIPIPRVKFEK